LRNVTAVYEKCKTGYDFKDLWFIIGALVEDGLEWFIIGVAQGIRGTDGRGWLGGPVL